MNRTGFCDCKTPHVKYPAKEGMTTAVCFCGGLIVTPETIAAYDEELRQIAERSKPPPTERE